MPAGLGCVPPARGLGCLSIRAALASWLHGAPLEDAGTPPRGRAAGRTLSEEASDAQPLALLMAGLLHLLC